jgi:hypothetical protein
VTAAAGWPHDELAVTPTAMLLETSLSTIVTLSDGLRNVVVSNNGAAGLDAKPNAIFRAAHSVFPGNGSVVATNGGTIFSYGDNDIDGNTNKNTGALTPLAMH